MPSTVKRTYLSSTMPLTVLMMCFFTGLLSTKLQFRGLKIPENGGEFSIELPSLGRLESERGESELVHG